MPDLLTPYILDLRDDCLAIGLREYEYWEMTIGEAVRALDAYEFRRKEKAYFAYTNAMAVGLFVASMFSSSKPPEISEIYPELFQKDEEAEQEKKDAASAANFTKFANAFNQRYVNGNGNGKSESKNNG